MKFSESDLHVHTRLSLCAKPTAIAADHIATLAANGVKTVGFSDHYWDEDVPGASGFYTPQDTAHVLAIREEVGDVSQYPVKVLFGCETEYAHGDLAITEKKAQLFDYVLVPHSHTHMRGFVLPPDCEAPDRHADYLVRSFYEVATHPLAKHYITGIVHPFYPCGTYGEDVTGILRLISDEQFALCAAAAAENDVAIEINMSSFTQACESAYKEYSRFYTACEKAGCTFFGGSDRHEISVGRPDDPFFGIDNVAEKLGVTKILIL